MLDYDQEAGHYDETRGGERRARAAAEALSQLLPDRAGLVLDVAGGTGIVAAALTRGQVEVVVCDTSHGMLRQAHQRLPGRALRGDATRLPVADDSVDAVLTVWLLHLLAASSVQATVCEAARVLRPGGRFVTTVDKNAAQTRTSSYAVTDDRSAVTEYARLAGLQCVAADEFAGHGQCGGIGDDGEPVYTLLAFEKVRCPER